MRLPDDHWPHFKRQEVGNCAFCWAAAWSQVHEPECRERQLKYYAEQDKKIKERNENA